MENKDENKIIKYNLLMIIVCIFIILEMTLKRLKGRKVIFDHIYLSQVGTALGGKGFKTTCLNYAK